MAAGVNVKLTVAGEPIPADHFISMNVDRDMFQPDMATVVVSNNESKYSGSKITGEIELKVGSDEKSIYKGEIVGLEPHYTGDDKTRIVMRSMNGLHKLTRKRGSFTYQNQTDQAILNQVVQRSGMTLDWKHSKTITYKHVYQHNMSDLEFLRMRAGRLGCHVWCVGTTIYCKEPDLQTTSKVTLTIDPNEKGAQLLSFRPRMSSSSIVKKVTVKGWNPETKELITGQAEAKSSSLGDTNASTGSQSFGGEETFMVDQPIWAKDEADALAAGKLSDLSLAYITGDAEAMGDADFDLGTVIKITASMATDPFNGKYYVMGVSHRYTGGSKDGYTSLLRLARDAQGG